VTGADVWVCILERDCAAHIANPEEFVENLLVLCVCFY